MRPAGLGRWPRPTGKTRAPEAGDRHEGDRTRRELARISPDGATRTDVAFTAGYRQGTTASGDAGGKRADQCAPPRTAASSPSNSSPHRPRAQVCPDGRVAHLAHVR